MFIHGSIERKRGEGRGKGVKKKEKRKTKKTITRYLKAWVECCSHPEPSMVECILALRQVLYKVTLEPHHIGWVVI